MIFVSDDIYLTIGRKEAYMGMMDFLTQHRKIFEGIEKCERVLIKINIPYWITPRGSFTNKMTLLDLVASIEKIYDKPVQIVESRYGWIPVKVLQEYGIPMTKTVDLFERPAFNMDGFSLKGRKKLHVAREGALRNDLFKISLGPPKTHEFVIYTGAIKTKMGFLKEKKRHMHGFSNLKYFRKEDVWENSVKVLHRNLEILNCCVEIDASILDGTSCMEGNGPVWGQEVKWDMWAASNSPTVLDYTVSTIMGLNPKEIAYIWLPLADRISLIRNLDHFLTDPRILNLEKSFIPPDRFKDELLASLDVIEKEGLS